MENKDKILVGIIGVLSVLLGSVGGLLLSPEQFDKAYVCSSNEKLGFFDRLSSTSKTGYYQDETGVERRNICIDGTWIKLVQYANSKGMDASSFLVPRTEEPSSARKQQSGGKEWLCNIRECVPK